MHKKVELVKVWSDYFGRYIYECYVDNKLIRTFGIELNAEKEALEWKKRVEEHYLQEEEK